MKNNNDIQKMRDSLTKLYEDLLDGADKVFTYEEYTQFTKRIYAFEQLGKEISGVIEALKYRADVLKLAEEQL